MELTDRFSEALAYTVKLHAAQKRKVSRAPYVSHLLRVAGIALEYGADEDEAIAALLHDAVEDQGGTKTLEDIRRRFGPRVAAIVAGCTDTAQSPKPPWRERKEAYLASLREASPSARLVSAADKLDNVRSLIAEYRALGESMWGQFKGGRDGTLWYYRSAAGILKAASPGALVEEVDRAVAQLEELTRGKAANSS
jgi:(p)ppGpp synthase/HD superfamily hydrolase